MYSCDIPWSILENTIECQLSFLKGLFDDNNNCIIDTDTRDMYLIHTSEILINSIQIILLNNGIITKKQTLMFGIRKIFQLMLIQNDLNLKTFNQKIGFTCKYKQQLLLDSMIILNANANTNTNTNLNLNILHQQISNITYSKAQLYDISVPNNDHTFIGNGFVNHNCQGMTIEHLEVNLAGVFAPGHVYTALSRAVTLDNLRVLNFIPSTIKVHKDVVPFYQQINDNWKSLAETMSEDKYMKTTANNNSDNNNKNNNKNNKRSYGDFSNEEDAEVEEEVGIRNDKYPKINRDIKCQIANMLRINNKQY
jgi:hypothetical protein